MPLNKVTVEWGGWPGAPGFSTHYFDSSSAPPLAALRTLYTSVAGIIAVGITLQIKNVGMLIDETNGQVGGTWSGSPQAVLVGAGATAYAGPAGGVLSWRTGIFAGGREVRGRTFIVPLGANNYDTNGTLVPSVVTAMNTALATFLAAAPNLRVYSPTSHSSAAVTSAFLIDKSVILRSRRQ